MAKWGKFDFEQLKKLQKNLQRLSATDEDAFCRACCKELAARLLSLVIPKTPVGQYPKSTGKTGGTLRRGWTANKNESAYAYAQSLQVEKVGNNYVIEVVNPVDYASYVEFGHRTGGGKGWVPGHFMLTKSEEELRQILPGILEKKLRAMFKEAFNV